jgi:uncharacterized cupin superfamily protein
MSMTDPPRVQPIDAATVAPLAIEARAEILREGNPRQTLWQALSLGDGALTAGTWEGEACILDIAAYPVTEVFFVLSGFVRLEETDGTTVEVGPGLGACVPKGWRGRWHTVERTRKHYVNLAAAPFAAAK